VRGGLQVEHWCNPRGGSSNHGTMHGNTHVPVSVLLYSTCHICGEPRMQSTLVARASDTIESTAEKGSTIRRRSRIAIQLIEAVDETLEMFFGRKTKSQIYDYLQESGARKGETLENPESFSEGLFNLFGPTSRRIELYIAKNLYKKLEVGFEPSESSTFADYITRLSTIDSQLTR